jgi:hypothetical protein
MFRGPYNRYQPRNGPSIDNIIQMQRNRRINYINNVRDHQQPEIIEEKFRNNQNKLLEKEKNNNKIKEEKQEP